MIYNYKDWVVRSPATISTLNRLLSQYYMTRNRTVPKNPTKKKTNDGCVIRFARESGKFQRIGHLDYTMFYPNIVHGLKLNPAADELRSYSHVVHVLLKNINHTNWKEKKKIKSLLTKMCSGYLNCEDFIFRDSVMHRKVLLYGSKILRQAINIVDEDPRFKLLTANTDGCHIECLENNNIQRHFKELADNINNTVNKPFLKIRVKEIWTNIHIFNTLKYHTYNYYSGDSQFKGMHDFLYNFHSKMQEEDKHVGHNSTYN